ncbi:MAG: NADH-quinone oxidoreductase subunit NuoF [Candidatus Aminicenantes bacterium]|nr:NADH-quinone oxidoreductase subunit NuoF [Candidatus Aminicenantes bacterium]
MNKLKALAERSRAEWQALHHPDRARIYLGMASCGRAAGSEEVRKTVLAMVKKHRIAAQLVDVGCIGPCYLEPLMDIAAFGKPRISYGNVNPAKAEMIIEKHLRRGEIVRNLAVGHFADAPCDDLPEFFAQPMLKHQVRIVLKNCGFIDPENIRHYLARDGYSGLQKALELSPDQVIEAIAQSGLRGRGGAGFPTGKKWQICRETGREPRYIICNADEGDPGAFMNRSLLESDPHSVLEGMLIAGYAIGASMGTIYIRAEYPLAIQRLKTAIRQMKENGLLGRRILGSAFHFDLKIKEGAGAFVCGEETALIQSIEGQRGMPRTKPPFPASSGLFGAPTVINNVETLGTVPHILRNGPTWYRQFGTEGNVGTKTFSLVGKVRRTGLIEVPLGTPLRKIIQDIGGGPQKTFKAVQTGGPSGGCLPEELLDTPVTYESLAAAGSIMGSGGLIVMDRDTCVVDVARYFLDFIQRESCGKCTSCRVGTRHMVEILERICKGEGEIDDLNKLESLARTVKSTSLCGLGQTAPNPVLTTLRYFRNEYVEHVVGKYCPALVCRSLIEYYVIPDKCTGCQRCVGVCPTGAISGPRSEPHNLDKTKCIKCRACLEICRFDAIAGNAIAIRTRGES